MSYRTYIVGADANLFYSKKAMDQLKGNMFFSQLSDYKLFGYYSNWRILHIDGFESGYGHRKISFNFLLSAPLNKDQGCCLVGCKCLPPHKHEIGGPVQAQ